MTLLLLSSLLLFSKTLVTVNGHKITDALLSKDFKTLDETKKQILIEQLIKEEVLYGHLLKSPLVNTQEFQQAFNQQKALVEQQYGKQLNQEQLRSIKGAIAVALYQQKEFQQANVTNQEIKDFYNNNYKLLSYPNSIEIADIIVEDKQTAENILKTLKKSSNLDKDFIEKAHELKQNGYLGWFGKDAVPQNLFDKAYKYKKRRLINTPIKTKHGYNIVYLLNKKPAGQLSYKEAKPKIKQLLKQQKVIKKLRAKMEKLYGEAEVLY